MARTAGSHPVNSGSTPGGVTTESHMVKLRHMNEEKLNLWREKWGNTYDRDFKRKVMGNLLERMSIKGRIGQVVLDVGSGKEPVSKLIPEPKKVITIDVGGTLALPGNNLHLQYDFEDLSQKREPISSQATDEIAKFLGREPQEIRQNPWADTIIMADILNYVPYEATLNTSSKLLRPGGRIVIFNKPGRGYSKDLFSENGLKINSELFEEIEINALEIEYRDFPWEMPGEEEFRDETMVVLVAKKMLERDRNRSLDCARDDVERHIFSGAWMPRRVRPFLRTWATEEVSIKRNAV